jgi:hypothetical protein
MSDQIEIKIDSKRLTPERFMEAVESFFALIQGVAKNVAQKPVHWSVEVEKGSAVVRALVDNPTPDARETINAVCLGVRSMRSGSKVIPHGFTPNEVRASRKLASLIDGKEVKSVSIKNGNMPEDLPQTIVQIADAILSGEHHIAFGSIEGKIDSLSDKTKFMCSVYEPLLRREITCYFQKPEVEQEAIKGFRKRVLAGGMIRYAKEGYPTSIVVDTIRIFPDESELPTVEDIQAIYKRYKNG